MAVIIQHITGDLRVGLGRDQYAVGPPRAVQRLHTLVPEALRTNPGDVVIQLDASSAFNTLDRARTVENIERILPG